MTFIDFIKFDLFINHSANYDLSPYHCNLKKLKILKN